MIRRLSLAVLISALFVGLPFLGGLLTGVSLDGNIGWWTYLGAALGAFHSLALFYMVVTE